MTKRNLIILAVATCLVLGATDAAAGPGAGKGRAGAGALGECTGDGPGPVGGFGFLGRGLRHLDLSQQQRDAIRAILETERPKIQELRRQLWDNRDKFRAENPPTQFNEAAVRAHAEAQARIRTELAVVMARTRARALAVLTPVQQAKLGELRSGREQRWGGKGCDKGRGKGMGGGWGL